jgi:eukaryotic-like serine/threonine-protein kinase
MLPVDATSPMDHISDEDDEVVRVLDAYLADIESGRSTTPELLLAQHPAIAQRLRSCLAGLQLVDAAAPSESCAGELGGYQIVREIGRGGMGIVYEAIQRSNARRVALKVLPFAAALDPRQLQRFKNEAHAAAQLRHRHIVPVYEVGCAGGTHFYTMQFIEGASLSSLWHKQRRQALEQSRRQTPQAVGNTTARAADATDDGNDRLASLRWDSVEYVRAIAELGRQAAAALDHAHQIGVIHRDIKPGNLLVDRGGRLWITDFGLASVQGAAGLTASGDLLGTLRYMSPEQASARRGVVDHRTDIYSLGVTLYEMLTLRPAIAGRDRVEILTQLDMDEPRSPARYNAAIARDLETIVCTAMARSLTERYPTARALADDLDRFLASEPIHARRPGAVARLRKWAFRHRAWAAAIGLFMALAAVGLAISTAVVWRALRAEEQQRALAETRQAESQRHLYLAHMNLAFQDWQSGNVARVLERLERHRPPTGQMDLRGFEWHHLWHCCQGAGIHALRAGQQPLTSVAASEDGRWWAAAGDAGQIFFWNAATQERLPDLPAIGGRISGLAMSPDGQRLAAAYSDHAVRLWDLATGKSRVTLTGHNGEVSAVTFSPNGRQVISASYDCSVRVWDPDRGQATAVLQGMESALTCVAISPDGMRIAASGHGRTVGLWDLSTADTSFTALGSHRVYVQCLAFSPDGQSLLSGSEDGVVNLWKLSSRKLKYSLRRHTGAVVAAAFAPDGRHVATASWDGSLKVWDVETQAVRLQQGHPGQITALAFAADGKSLLSVGEDACVRSWNLTATPEPATLQGHTRLIRGLTFSPSGDKLVSTSADGTVRVWDCTGNHAPVQIDDHDSWVMGAAFAPGGEHFWSADFKGSVFKFAAASGSLLQRLEPAGLPIWSLALSADGQTLAGAGYDSNAVVLWEVASGKKKHTLVGHLNRVWVVAFSPHEPLLASSSNDYSVRFWNAASGDEVAKLDVPVQWIYALAFAPDGKTLALAGGDNRVRLCDVASRREIGTLARHPAAIRSIAFFPDGGALATASDDGTVKLWDLVSRQERITLQGDGGADVRASAIGAALPASSLWSLAISPDGQAIAAGDGDGRITLWRAGARGP